MQRLKFEMWKDREGNIMSRFTDGNGHSTDSYWSSPPASIDHVGLEYLSQRHRHPNVRNVRHNEFIKRRYKEEMVKLRMKKVECINDAWGMDPENGNMSISFKRGKVYETLQPSAGSIEDDKDTIVLNEDGRRHIIKTEHGLSDFFNRHFRFVED